MNDLTSAQNYLMSTYAHIPLVLTHGEGSTLYDEKGQAYLDLTSGIGVSSLGYGNKSWIQAVTDQVQQLAHSSNIFLNGPVLRLAKALTEAAAMRKVFFANSGAEANEGAIKLARKYSVMTYGEGRSTILTLNRSFHGRTLATLTATGQDKFHHSFGPFPEGFVAIEPTKEALHAALDGTVCAIMMEAIQGEGGIHPLPQTFVNEVMAIAKENDILVMFDEVQCGMGRTGKLFGYQHFAIQPDIVTTAKGLAGGLPIGAVLCNEKLEKTFQPGDHGSTFGGNPISCAGGYCVVETLTSPGFLEAVAARGAEFKAFFEQNRSDKIHDVRGIGLMVGIELTQERAVAVQKAALSKGVLVLTAGPRILRLLPPLVITRDELHQALTVLLSCIDAE